MTGSLKQQKRPSRLERKAQAAALAHIVAQLLAAMPLGSLTAPGGLLHAQRPEFLSLLEQIEALHDHAERLNAPARKRR